ncbi:VOC family protein [Paracoccus sanguinis]|uniref:PhnB protein n=1 Tax=Paracoccus sanguinis TaxID=1545044 RepID=A0A099G4F4_9RHOB|nr:VOC family protein [Paracoccus sanguinis]KGJ14676.1 hypothetical protein IX54_05595 [Paracoccus sanguinis]KGJ17620.1 hypothetical protein IX57_07710 [Paracoccus sanguinis]KGJ21683.1 hypothetical protein IX55_00870 [Paracoccus sanguinis]KGJ23048.1 hypothetical protein IX56_04620 [Paracoccus sanguinis]QJD16694.1 VOC family protein [Paracoccus sanguinis]
MFVPYLMFPGHAAQAFAAYAEIFGGTLETSRFSDIPPGAGAPELPAEQRDWLMHARLEAADGGVLMGSDAPPQFADPTEPDGQRQSGVSVAVSRPDPASARILFDRLAAGGDVTMPFGETFFAKGFGMCRDRFGTHWMISAAD